MDSSSPHVSFDMVTSFYGGDFFYESHCCCLVLSPWCVHWEHFYQVLLLSQCSAARKLLVIESVLHLRWPGRVIKATPTSCRKILCGNRIMGLYQGAWCYFIFPISILWFKKSSGMFCIPQSYMTQFWAERLVSLTTSLTCVMFRMKKKSLSFCLLSVIQHKYWVIT